MQLTPLTDRAAAAPFAGMTYPHYVPDLLGVEPDGPVVAVGATDPDPCGLVLARVNESDEATLLSVLVKAPHRKQGIGTALVQAAEQLLRERGAPVVSGTYPSGKESTPVVERVLAKCGWDAPQPSMYLFTFPPGQGVTRDAVWLAPHPWPEGFAFVLWDEIPHEAWDDVARRVESGEVPWIVSPFREPEAVDRRGSFGLMRGDRLVGWTLVHATGPKTVRGTALYAEPGATPPGVGLQLLAASFRRFLELNDAGEGLTASWGIHAANPFLRVFQRRVLRSMPNHTVTVTMGTSKQLG